MLVEEDSWTFDRFSEMVQAVSIDVNGDGMMTDGDISGCMVRLAPSTDYILLLAAPFTARQRRETTPSR